MQETVDSIKEYGVLNPCIVRPREGGGYEIISGHRRKYACQLAGKAKIPAIIRKTQSYRQQLTSSGNIKGTTARL